MSYIRAGFKGTYEAVDMEETQDYVFPYSTREPIEGEKREDTWLVEDYGSISNFGLVEKLHVPLKEEFIVEAYRNSQTI